MCVYVCMYVCLCVYVCMCVCVYSCTCVSACVYVCMYVFVYVCVRGRVGQYAPACRELPVRDKTCKHLGAALRETSLAEPLRETGSAESCSNVACLVVGLRRMAAIRGGSAGCPACENVFVELVDDASACIDAQLHEGMAQIDA